jgi:hypothetical protein
MKLSSVIFILLLLGSNGLFAQQAPSAEPTSEKSPEEQLKELRWNLNIILNQQLPSSLPDSLNGKTFRKSFSFNPPQNAGGLLEVRELRRTVERDSTFGGSKYQIATNEIDIPNIRIVNSPDGKFTSLEIPAKPGSTFLHRPYGNEPERKLPSLVIGWYERIQDKTLARALTAIQLLLMELSK